VTTPVLTERDAAVRRARLLNRLTVGWNVVEAVVALAAGVAVASVGLVAFGLDSVVEVSAALVMTWRLAQEGKGGCTQEADRRAVRGLAVAFFALAAYVTVDAAGDLLGGTEPGVSVVGIWLTAVSAVVMPVLARAKRRLAPVLGSRAQASEARQTDLCAWLSWVLLAGLLLNAALGWWWADPAAALVIAAVAAREGLEAWRSESLEDTCCG
jgi:divalent metal cation (Fe/Co/Zn/Cd) transporter